VCRGCAQVESLQEALQSSRQDVCRLRGAEMKVNMSPCSSFKLLLGRVTLIV